MLKKIFLFVLFTVSASWLAETGRINWTFAVSVWVCVGSALFLSKRLSEFTIGVASFKVRAEEISDKEIRRIETEAQAQRELLNQVIAGAETVKRELESTRKNLKKTQQYIDATKQSHAGQ